MILIFKINYLAIVQLMTYPAVLHRQSYTEFSILQVHVKIFVFIWKFYFNAAIFYRLKQNLDLTSQPFIEQG